MKGARLSDTIQNIKRHWVSFLAIVFIVSIAAMAYLGVNYAADAMKKAGDTFYNQSKYMDLELIASMHMSDEDMQAILATPGVEDAEAVYATEGIVGRVPVEIRSLTERVSVPALVEGRLPEKPTECVVELPSSEEEREAFVVGNTIRVTALTGQKADYLPRTSFEITGIVRHPDHLSVKLPDTPYVLVNADAFDEKALEGRFMGAQIRIADGRGKNTFSTSYYKAINPTVKALESLSEKRAKARDDEIQTKGEAEIGVKQAKLDKSKTALNKERTALDKKQAQLDKTKKDLEQTNIDLNREEKQLEKEKKEYDQDKKNLDEYKASVEKDKKKVTDQENDLRTRYERIRNKKNNLKNDLKGVYSRCLEADDFKAIRWAEDEVERDIRDTNVVAQEAVLTKLYTADLNDSLDALCEELLRRQGLFDDEIELYMETILEDETLQNWKTPYRELEDAAVEWDADREEFLTDVASQDNGAEKKLKDQQKAFDTKWGKFESKQKDFKNRKAKYQQAQKDYKQALKEQKQKEKVYADKEKKYNQGLEEVSDMQKKLDNMEECKWFQFTRKANASYIDLNMVSGNLGKLGITFSLLFILLGAIVCAATISRMIDEQSRMIGIQKAQGLYDYEIFSKYRFFGLFASAIGLILGIAAAYFFLQEQLLKGYGEIYVLGDIPRQILPVPTLLVVVCTGVLTLLAVAAGTLRMQRASISAVMSGSLSDLAPKRVRTIVTIASVAGCCALLVIGFTLKHAVNGVPSKQFGEIVLYDADVSYNPYMDDKGHTDMAELVREHGAECYDLFETNVTYRVDADSYEVGELMVVPDKGFGDFFTLRDAATDKKLSPVGDGVLIQKRLAETYDIRTGDELILYDQDAKGRKVKVRGIFNNYTGRTMIMDAEYYQTMFGTEAVNNRLLVRAQNADQKELEADLSLEKKFLSYRSSDRAKTLFAAISHSLNGLIALLTTLAILLGVLVVSDFANLYVLQRKRELVVLRLNGFSVREARRYILPEVYVTTTGGIVLGIAVGAGLSYWIVRLLEQPHVQLVRSVSIDGWIFAAVFTLLLIYLIYAAAFSGIRKLKLTDMEES